MAVQTNTFKGARYVPKFYGDWEQTESYEAIGVVKHNAFTYISKQPVPANVEITNTDFWLLWADPNAQMEELRQIFMQYVDAVEELSGVVDQWADKLAAEIQNREAADNILRNQIVDINKYNIKNYGANENDPETLQQAVNRCAAENDYIFIPAGVWKLNNTLEIPGNVHGVYGDNKSTVIKPNDVKLDCLIELLTSTKPQYAQRFVKNIAFETDYDETHSYYPDWCLEVGEQTSVIDCDFKNAFGGVKSSSYGLYVRNCNFTNRNVRGKEIPEDSIGIYCGSTDCVVNDTKIWGFTYGIRGHNLSTCNFDNVYFWQHWSLKPTYGIYNESFTLGAAMVNNCYFDGITRALCNFPYIATNCIFLYGDKDTLGLDAPEYDIFFSNIASQYSFAGYSKIYSSIFGYVGSTRSIPIYLQNKASIIKCDTVELTNIYSTASMKNIFLPLLNSPITLKALPEEHVNVKARKMLTFIGINPWQGVDVEFIFKNNVETNKFRLALEYGEGTDNYLANVYYPKYPNGAVFMRNGIYVKITALLNGRVQYDLYYPCQMRDFACQFKVIKNILNVPYFEIVNYSDDDIELIDIADLTEGKVYTENYTLQE